jgi:hypothetical protein
VLLNRTASVVSVLVASKRVRFYYPTLRKNAKDGAPVDWCRDRAQERVHSSLNCFPQLARDHTGQSPERKAVVGFARRFRPTYPGFPVEVGGLSKTMRLSLRESRIRGRGLCCVVGGDPGNAGANMGHPCRSVGTRDRVEGRSAGAIGAGMEPKKHVIPLSCLSARPIAGFRGRPTVSRRLWRG